MLLLRRQGVAGLDTMPFAETFPATGTGSVLCDENGVSAHGSLPAVIGNVGRCQTETDEVSGVSDNRVQSFFIDILALRFSQMKTGAKT